MRFRKWPSLLAAHKAPTKTVPRNEAGGLSIAFVFFMVLMLTTLGVVGHSIMTTDNLISLRYVQGVQAQYLAEAGMQYGIKLVIDGQALPYSETVDLYGGSFELSLVDQDTVIVLTSTGGMDAGSKGIQVIMKYRPPIGDFAIYATGDIDNVDALDEDGDPDPALMVDNAPSLPDIDTPALIAMATAQGHVYTSDVTPSHGYPNFNFYFSAGIPNVTYVQGDMTVNGGTTIYGIFIVEGDIRLNGSSRVEGVLYLTNPNTVVIHGGGNPTESSVTGGIIANGDVDGTGNHITVHYNAEYMGAIADFETIQEGREILSWKEL